MNPAPFLAVAHDPGVLEHPQMERQARLRGVEGIGQLAHAPLSLAQKLDDTEPGLIRQCVKELDRALGPGIRCGRHSSIISINLVTSMSACGWRCQAP